MREAKSGEAEGGAPTAPAAPGLVATAKDMKKAYGIQEIPVVYVFDAAGTVTHAHIGATDELEAALDRAVAALVGGGAK